MCHDGRSYIGIKHIVAWRLLKAIAWSTCRYLPSLLKLHHNNIEVRNFRFQR